MLKELFQMSLYGQVVWRRLYIFFKVCLLPEVLGRWYSRPQIGTKDNEGTSSASLEVEHSNRSEHCSQVTSTSPVYCYCNGLE